MSDDTKEKGQESVEQDECSSCTGSCGNCKNKQRSKKVAASSNELEKKIRMLEAVRDQRNALSDKVARLQVALKKCQERRGYFQSISYGLHKIVTAQADSIFRLKQEVTALNAVREAAAMPEAAGTNTPVPEPTTTAAADVAPKSKPKSKKNSKKSKD